jgi:hypothetical protein
MKKNAPKIKKTWARGRKPVSDEPLILTPVRLTDTDRAWLRSKGEISATIRSLIAEKREAESV